ncbi:MAG: NUDIX domain-containing protein [Nanoarchaeota archaeon]
MKGKFRKGVFIATYKRDNNKIIYLLLKRKLHWTGWEFPKGGVEKGEINKTAAARELKEETGQSSKNIKSYDISGKYKYNKEYPDRKGFQGQSYKLFSAEIKNKKAVNLDKREHSSYKWLDFNNAWKTLTWPNQKICLNVVNKSLTK